MITNLDHLDALSGKQIVQQLVRLGVRKTTIDPESTRLELYELLSSYMPFLLKHVHKAQTRPPPARIPPTWSNAGFAELSVKELKQWVDHLGIPVAGLNEKQEIVDILEQYISFI